MSSTEQPSPSEKPENRASTPKRIRQKYFFMWIGGITVVLITVALVANFKVGNEQFKSEMKDHWNPTQPLAPHVGPLPAPLPATPPVAAGTNSAARLEQVYNQIAAAMNQVTVSLSTAGAAPNASGTVIGSGFWVGGGYVLTNFHVVQNVPAIEVTVYAPSKARYPAQLAQNDPADDLALLKVQAAGDFPAAPLGNSDAVDAGDLVLAVGSPLGVGNTISSGMISAVRKTITIGGRVYQDLLQTTTPIYLGSSGGPLVNLDGRVIGINTVIYAPAGNFTGISFAVPINRAQPLLEQALPALAQNQQPQRFGLAGGGCAVSPNAPGCFVPAAAPVPAPAPPPVITSNAQAMGPFPVMRPWTMLRCPGCQVYRYPRCPVCNHRMVLDATGTRLVCPLGHTSNLGQQRCPICGGPVVAHVHGQPFSLA